MPDRELAHVHVIVVITEIVHALALQAVATVIVIVIEKTTGAVVEIARLRTATGTQTATIVEEVHLNAASKIERSLRSR